MKTTLQGTTGTQTHIHSRSTSSSIWLSATLWYAH
jgi:hypothetical protein